MFGRGEEVMMPLMLVIAGVVLSGCIPFVPIMERADAPVQVAQGGVR